MIKSILIGESICLFNFISFYGQNNDVSPWVLYHACLDPWSIFQFPLTKLMPVNQLILHISSCINIFCNLWLYRYLNRMTKENMALNARDKKKEKKRNLIPAKTGMIYIAAYIFTFTFFMFTFSYESASLDSATRAFLNAVYGDFVQCICNPAIIIYWSSDARKRFKKIIFKSV